jgi:hypothetical protein
MTLDKRTAGTFLIASIAAWLAGCASAPEETAAPDAPAAKAEKLTASELEKKFQEVARGYKLVERDGKTLYCKNEKIIGSTVPRLQCHTESQLRNQVESMEELRQQMRTSGKCTLGRGCTSG